MLDKLLQLIVPVAMKFLRGLADNQIEGEKLSATQKMLAWNSRNIVATFGQSFAAETDNTYDDDAVNEVLVLADDTLQEAGITPAPVPDFGTDEEEEATE